MEVKLRLGKDEKRAREGGIMLSVKVVVLDDTSFSIVDVSKSINRLACNYKHQPPQDIIALPMDEFNDLIGKQGYSEEQLNMCRDIRKRGKNKVRLVLPDLRLHDKVQSMY